MEETLCAAYGANEAPPGNPVLTRGTTAPRASDLTTTTKHIGTFLPVPAVTTTWCIDYSTSMGAMRLMGRVPFNFGEPGDQLYLVSPTSALIFSLDPKFLEGGLTSSFNF